MRNWRPTNHKLACCHTSLQAPPKRYVCENLSCGRPYKPFKNQAQMMNFGDQYYMIGQKIDMK